MFVKNLVIDENQLKTYLSFFAFRSAYIHLVCCLGENLIPVYLPELLPFELHPPVLLFVCVDDYDLASNDVIYDHR